MNTLGPTTVRWVAGKRVTRRIMGMSGEKVMSAAATTMKAVVSAGFVLTFSFLALSPARGQASGMQGDAAWSESRVAGQRTASGERYDPESMTAASHDLPFDTLVRITRTDNGRTVVVRINDRVAGDGHIIHLSEAASRHIGVSYNRPAPVRLQPLRDKSLTVIRHPDDRRWRSQPANMRSGSRIAANKKSSGRVRVAVAEPVRAATDGRTEGRKSSNFTLQVGVFSSRDAATAFSGGFSDGWIQPITVEGKAQFRVYFSRFGEEAPARTAQNSLRRQGHDSFLRTISS